VSDHRPASDGSSGLSLAVRDRLSTVAPFLVVGLLVVAGVGGWLTYTAYVDPGVTTEERTVSRWTTETSMSHSARVVRENRVFPVGSTLEDRSVYYTRVSPVLNGTHAFDYESTGGGSLAVVSEATLVVRAVSEADTSTTGGGNRTVYWRVTEPLETVETSSVAPDESVRLPFSVNVSELTQRRENITASLGGSIGEVESVVRVTTSVEGTADGRTVSERVVSELAVAPEGATYRVEDGPASGRQVYDRTEQVRTQQEYGLLWTVGGPVSSLVGLLGAVLVLALWITGRFTLSDRERAVLTYERAREEFDEWVTTAQVDVEELTDAQRITVDSLEGLVDTAIDTNNRVLEDAPSGRHYVLTERVVYEYDPPRASGYDTGRVSRTDRPSEDSDTTGRPESGATDMGDSPRPGATGTNDSAVSEETNTDTEPRGSTDAVDAETQPERTDE
jgi:hypothetical protein